MLFVQRHDDTSIGVCNKIGSSNNNLMQTALIEELCLVPKGILFRMLDWCIGKCIRKLD